MASKFVNKRDDEGAGLSTSSSGHSDDIKTLDDCWDSFSLNWSWQIITFIFDCLQQWHREIVVGKGSTNGCSKLLFADCLFFHLILFVYGLENNSIRFLILFQLVDQKICVVYCGYYAHL
jgi:hypothetical protein